MIYIMRQKAKFLSPAARLWITSPAASAYAPSVPHNMWGSWNWGTNVWSPSPSSASRWWERWSGGGPNCLQDHMQRTFYLPLKSYLYALRYSYKLCCTPEPALHIHFQNNSKAPLQGSEHMLAVPRAPNGIWQASIHYQLLRSSCMKPTCPLLSPYNFSISPP